MAVDFAPERVSFIHKAGSRRSEGASERVLVAPLGVEIVGLSVDVAQVVGMIRSGSIQRIGVTPKVSPVTSIAAVLATETATGL